MPDLSRVQRPIEELPIAAVIPIPGSPDWVGIAPQGVWISNKAANSLARIDLATNRVAATTPVGRAPCSGLAVGFGSVWAPSCGAARLERVDLRTDAVVASIPTTVADSEGGIAAGEGAVWMFADRQGALLRVDPTTNAVSGRIATAPGSYAPAVGAGSVWATCTDGDLVSRIDPRADRVIAEIPVGPTPRFLACGEGAVWILNQGDGTVSRIDPASNQVTATIAVGTPGVGGDVAVGSGFGWTTAIDVPLTQIDPRTNTVVAQYVGRGGDALRVGHGSVWMCSFFLQEVWRVPLPLP